MLFLYKFDISDKKILQKENREEFDKYTSVINKTIEKNGFKVTLNEIMLDNNQLRIATTFKSDKILKNKMVSTHLPQVFIDGKILGGSGASGVGENIDEYTCISINTFDVHDVKIPSNMNIKVVYEDIHVTGGSKRIIGT